MWGKGKPHTLLMGMLIGAVTVEGIMEVSQKTKNSFDVETPKPIIHLLKHNCIVEPCVTLFCIFQVSCKCVVILS